MCICVHINIKTHQQENSKTLKVVRVTPGTLYCCYQSHSGQPCIPMSNSLWGAQSAASPVSTLVCYVLWSPDMMATVRICVATLRVEHPICRNIPNNTHLVLSHPPSLALEYWTCYIYSLFRGSFPFLTDASHPGNLAHRSWPLLVEGKSLITGLRRMEHILFAKRRV
jgi:hypothetical protein